MLVILLASLSMAYSELIYLSAKNYTQSKKEYAPLVVFYYGADKQSQRFVSEFTLIANVEHTLQKGSSFPSNINFGLVNGVEEAKLIEKIQILNLPTIILFFGDNKVKYTNSLNAQAFINWLKKAVRDSQELNEFHPSSQILKWDQLSTKFKSFNLIAILVTPEYRVAPLKQFIQAAKQMPQGLVFCHIYDNSISKHLEVEKDDSALIIYNKNEDQEEYDDAKSKRWDTYLYRYQGDIKNSDEMLKFFKIHSFKKGFVYIDDTKFQKLARRSDRLPTVILLYNKNETSHYQYVQKFQDSRYALLNKAILGVIDINNDSADRLDRWFDINVTTAKIPQLIAIKPVTDNSFLKYKSDTMDPIEFAEQLPTLKPFYRDEGILMELYDGAGVKKLTRSTYFPFIKEMNDKGIDVVVHYTAKKCQPCKDFRPDYNQVYKTYKDSIENKVVFTRLDIEKNEIENLNIDNYPHVKLYAAGHANPFTLHEKKTEKGLISWLAQYSNYKELFGKQDL